MKQLNAIIFLAIGLIVCIMTAAGAVQAQQSQLAPGIVEPIVRLTETETGTFRLALEALARQAPVTFVAEGEPRKPSLAKGNAPVIAPEGMPLSDAAGRIAKAFDYDMKRQGNVFRLTKRYTDARDLPGITLEESRLFLADLLRVVEKFSPKVPPMRPSDRRGPLVNDIIALLTPEQISAMKDGLPVASLNAPLQAQMRRMGLYFYVQVRAEDLERSIEPLELATKNEPVFCWKEINGQRLFGYKLDFQKGSKLAEVPYFRSLYIAQTGTGSVAALGFGVQTSVIKDKYGNPRPQPTLVDPWAPTVADIDTAGNLPAVMTLKTVVATLSNRKEASPAKMTVDEALAEKPVTVAGEAHNPAAQIMTALAEIYGLRLMSEEDGTLRLTRRTVRVPAQLTGLPTALQSIFPEPLLRALRGEGRNTPNTAPSGLSAHISPQDAARVEAVRRLRAAIEPKVKAARERQVPLSSLSARENTALAALLLHDALQRTMGFTVAILPLYITEFDHLSLYGGVYTGLDGKSKFRILFGGQTPDGRRIPAVGFDEVNYP